MRCRWQDYQPGEDCALRPDGAYPCCAKHMRAILDRARAKLPNASPRTRRHVDTFVAAFLAAAGAAAYAYIDDAIALVAAFVEGEPTDPVQATMPDGEVIDLPPPPPLRVFRTDGATTAPRPDPIPELTPAWREVGERVWRMLAETAPA